MSYAVVVRAVTSGWSILSFRAGSPVVLWLLVLGVTAFGDAVLTEALTSREDLPPHRPMTDASALCGAATTDGCHRASLTGDVSLHAPHPVRRLLASTGPSVHRRDLVPASQLLWPMQQDLFLRNGHRPPAIIAAQSAGMDTPTARTGRVPDWATTMRAERRGNRPFRD